MVDAQTFEVEKYLLVGQRVWQLAFSPDEKFIYSTNGVSNDISVIDVENLEVDQVGHRRRLPLGRGGQGLSAIGRDQSPIAAGSSNDDETCIFAAAMAGRARRWRRAATVHAQAGLLSGRDRPRADHAGLGQAAGERLPTSSSAGKYYRIAIQADGSAELAVAGPEFFRNVWVNEVVINDIEVRPLGVDSIEFDDEGEATISFVPIRPGTLRPARARHHLGRPAGGVQRQVTARSAVGLT